MSAVIALLHPGEMGASIGACARAAGHEVRWVDAGRSSATAARAAAADLLACGSLSEALAGADVVMSVCPPGFAMDVARDVRAAGFRGLFVDANAVSPQSARAIAQVLGDIDYVDGGIVGPPAVRPGTTRLFLSGARRTEIAALFGGSLLECVCVDGDAGAASALKMCYAAWTKGSSAMLLAVRALAEHEGVADALQTEWQRSQPGTVERVAGAARGTPRKAWRFVGEMREIAATFEAAGLPGDFHTAAAEVYARLEGFKDAAPPDLDAVLAALLKSSPDQLSG